MLRAFMNQPGFDAWAEKTHRGYHILIATLMVLLVVCITAAILVMGPRLVREGTLLWFGARAEGTVSDIKLERVGSFKGGQPKYELTLDYRFVTLSGQQYAGSTMRGDVRTPPSLGSGDAVGVYYQASDPTRSVAEYRLRTDVYALVLFLPFLVVIGIIGPLWHLANLWAWRQRRRARA